MTESAAVLLELRFIRSPFIPIVHVFFMDQWSKFVDNTLHDMHHPHTSPRIRGDLLNFNFQRLNLIHFYFTLINDALRDYGLYFIINERLSLKVNTGC